MKRLESSNNELKEELLEDERTSARRRVVLGEYIQRESPITGAIREYKNELDRLQGREENTSEESLRANECLARNYGRK